MEIGQGASVWYSAVVRGDVEKIRIGAITGASATNTITFQGTSMDSTKVILTGSSSSRGDGTVDLVRNVGRTERHDDVFVR